MSDNNFSESTPFRPGLYWYHDGHSSIVYLFNVQWQYAPAITSMINSIGSELKYVTLLPEITTEFLPLPSTGSWKEVVAPRPPNKTVRCTLNPAGEITAIPGQ